MKKLGRMTGMASSTLVIMALAVTISSCDILKSDPGALKATANVINNQVYGLPTSSTLIDLASKIQTSQPVTLTVTSQPRYGNLTNLGNGFVQYSPNPGATRDAFQFTLYDKQNTAIKTDSIVITVVSNSSQLPCGIYTSADYIYQQIMKDSSIWVNVLANDIICNSYSGSVTLSIYQPNPAVNYPTQGTVQIVNSGIQYIAAVSFANDQFYYKVQSLADPNVFAFGAVYILKAPPCAGFSLSNDLYNYSIDSLLQNTPKLFLPVFSNDIFCDTIKTNYTYSILSSPQNGTATIDDAGIHYSPSLVSGQIQTDSIKYQVCHFGTCLQAKVNVVFR